MTKQKHLWVFHWGDMSRSHWEAYTTKKKALARIKKLNKNRKVLYCSSINKVIVND